MALYKCAIIIIIIKTVITVMNDDSTVDVDVVC